MEEEQDRSIFNEIETQLTAPENVKKAVFSELEFLQNTSQVVEHFAGNYFNILVSVLSKDN
jgi:hypothetical protein